MLHITRSGGLTGLGSGSNWPFFGTTTDALDAEVEKAKSQIASLDADIQASAVSQAFRNSWDGYLQEFMAFYDDATPGFWVLQRGTLYDKAIEFQGRTRQWYQRFLSEGGHPSGVAPEESTPAPSTGDLLAKTLDMVPWIVGGLILYAGYSVYRDMTPKRGRR